MCIGCFFDLLKVGGVKKPSKSTNFFFDWLNFQKNGKK
jgi:hypothetical protein